MPQVLSCWIFLTGSIETDLKAHTQTTMLFFFLIKFISNKIFYIKVLKRYHLNK